MSSQFFSLPIMKSMCSRADGPHILLVYEDIESFREAYCNAAKAALPDDQILLILTYYETPETVKFYLAEAGIDVDRYARTESLFVIDSAQQFFNGSIEYALRFIELLHRKARHRGRKGVAVVAAMDAFFYLGDRDLAERFEEMVLPAGNPGKFTCLLCAYHRDTWGALSGPAQKRIRAQHVETLSL
ncbi:MEDS domain-containing protein [Nitrososphaera sp.]|uniref:MEDS domain-containing protein n=1 Tax=Nitrososphaera sp. TaxID=1971748 RepID=UPI00307DA33E